MLHVTDRLNMMQTENIERGTSGYVVIVQSVPLWLTCTRYYRSKLYMVGMVSGDLNHCRICTPASEDGLIESPKHVRQK
jgi:hypothetical protein